jgi:hypothetical protein
MSLSRHLRLLAAMAVLVTPSVALPKGVPVEDASEAQWRGAQKTFLAADELFDAKRYEEAISAYRASWEIVASPNTRLQVARCLRELGRVGEAYEELEGALADAERAAAKEQKYARAAVAARSELGALRSQVALVIVRVESVPEGTVFTVGERRVQLADFARPVAAAAGKIQVVARMPGRGAVVRTLTVAGGGEGSVALDLSEEKLGTASPTPAAEPPTVSSSASGGATMTQSTSLRPYAFIAGGVGVVGLAGFAVFGAMNNSKFSGLEDRCNAGNCPADSQSDINEGRRLQTFANIGLAVGVVGLGTSATLFLLDTGGEAQARVGVAPGSVTVSGRF